MCLRAGTPRCFGKWRAWRLSARGKPRPDGIRRARRLSAILAEAGILVVSGLAEGIDTAAHVAALEAHGATAAVIGTPLDRRYPRSNAELQERLAREQLLLSQFPIGMPVQRGNFPMRNRVMALISDATVIIEAADTSGSLSQGWEALRLGRALFIAQSAVNDKRLSWLAKMLAHGASVLSERTLDDLLGLLRSRSCAEFNRREL